MTIAASSWRPDSGSTRSTRAPASPIPSFGANGSVSLLEGLGRDVSNLYVLSNTPGAIYKDLLILGTRVSEGPGPVCAGAHPGLRRAHREDPVDVPDDPVARRVRLRHLAARTPGPASAAPTRGAGSASTPRAASCSCRSDRRPSISGAAIGTARTCSPTRVLALKADTGERVWHYQLVHHDLWDRDPPAAPVLVTVQRERPPRGRGGAGHQVRSRLPVRPREGHAAVPDRGAPGSAV